jgi:hypothetical protein
MTTLLYSKNSALQAANFSLHFWFLKNAEEAHCMEDHLSVVSSQSYRLYLAVGKTPRATLTKKLVFTELCKRL